ncbi:hypothetical protein PHLCEN_2v3558 [Hermanssonia centrifuga]|uniref:Origin recognition complex subunit 2 n=1 Tax=Hermanssonia centrifuga TaxID=98765 RepID=A0A2R6QET3_9APHY|nr:hypothetical protein PHLCEN_2v3558 [Hermanssonia centrifuga]
MDYFNSRPTQTSHNVFPPINVAEIPPSSLRLSWHALFPRLLTQLHHGFNLVVYGAGSKRAVLNALAVHINALQHTVLVLNAFHPAFTLPDIPQSDVYLVIHNIDALKKAQLALLTASPRVHIVASVDNIAFPHQWSLSDMFSRTYPWLYHDLTTFDSYHFELAYADRTSLTGAPSKSRSASTLVTEVAARHILVSVTQKAKNLFVLLATHQLQLMQHPDATNDPEQLAFDYNSLFLAARDNFVASNDTALRALMSEFRDHGLIASVNHAGAGEAVWIPLRKEALEKIVHDLKKTT